MKNEDVYQKVLEALNTIPLEQYESEEKGLQPDLEEGKRGTSMK